MLVSPTPEWTDRPAFYYKPEASKTLQDYPYNKEKADGDFRIAVLGDSFAFGTSMQFDDTFAKKLERMLNLSSSDKRVQVLNFGVPGFSTYHELQSFRQAVRAHADLVILQVTLNDPQLKPYVPEGITGKNPFGELKPGENLRALYTYWKSLGFLARRLHNSRTHRSYKNYYFSLFERNNEWSAFSQAIAKMGEKAKKRKVTLVGVIFPLFGLPLDKSYPFKPLHEKIKQLFVEKQLAAIDLFPVYENLPLERIQLIPGQDFHPNEIGHRLAAEALYSWLEEKKLVPEEFLIKDKYKDRLNIHGAKNHPLG